MFYIVLPCFMQFYLVFSHIVGYSTVPPGGADFRVANQWAFDLLHWTQPPTCLPFDCLGKMSTEITKLRNFRQIALATSSVLKTIENQVFFQLLVWPSSSVDIIFDPTTLDISSSMNTDVNQPRCCCVELGPWYQSIEPAQVGQISASLVQPQN